MRSFVLSLASAVLCCGCGGRSDHADLNGEVLLDGQPLPDGSVLLVPVNSSKGTTAGGAIKDGKFAINGKAAPGVGEYMVEIHASKLSGRKVQKAMGKKGELDDEMVEAVAPRFNARTELRVEVKPGGTNARFEVFSR